MFAFLIFLVLPAFGGLMWLARRKMLRGEDCDEREFGRRILLLIGWSAVGFATLSSLSFMYEPLRQPEPADFQLMLGFELTIKVTAVVLLLIPGIFAIRVASTATRQEESLGLRAEYIAAEERLEIFCLLLLGMPLLIFSPIICVLLITGVGLEVLFLNYVQRERHNRLLWTLAFTAHQGRPLDTGVTDLVLQSRGRHRRKLESLAASLENGTPLSQAVATTPGLLPIEMNGLIRAGEENGNLPEVLRNTAMRESSRIKLQARMQSLAGTTSYMCALLLIMTSVVGFLSYFIVPKYLHLLEELDATSPWVTEQYEVWSDFFSEFWYLVIPMLTLPFLLILAIVSATSSGLRVPARLRSLWPRLSTPIFLRSLAEAAQAEKSILPVVHSLAESTTDRSLKARYERIAHRLEMGEALHSAMASERVVRPAEARAMEHAGQLGHLPWAMQSLAARIDRARQHQLLTLAEWVQPLTIIAAGGLILIIAIACLFPIISVIEDLS